MTTTPDGGQSVSADTAAMGLAAGPMMPEQVPAELVYAAETGYSMHGAGLTRNILAAVLNKLPDLGWQPPGQADPAEVLRIVADWCIEANDVGGLDAGDLADRLAEAGCSLPDEVDDEPSPESDTCRPVQVDGETILVRGQGELDDVGRQSLLEVYKAAKARMKAEEEAARAAIEAETERRVRRQVAAEARMTIAEQQAAGTQPVTLTGLDLFAEQLEKSVEDASWRSARGGAE